MMNAFNTAWSLLKYNSLFDFVSDNDDDEIHLGIVGSRNLENYDNFKDKVYDWIAQNGQPTSIISGGQRGVDSMARMFAEEHDIPFTEHHHNDYRHLGRRMYAHRNQLIVNDATHLLAFPSREGRGTQMTMGMANRKGIPVHHHWEEEVE